MQPGGVNLIPNGAHMLHVLNEEEKKREREKKKKMKHRGDMVSFTRSGYCVRNISNSGLKLFGIQNGACFASLTESNRGMYGKIRSKI